MDNSNTRIRKMILVSMFAALTAIGAYIRIPFLPVPFTLQILFVLLSGLLLGSKLGFASQIVYIAVGLVGVPVFTDGGGLGYIFNIKFGYLLGFAATAFVTGLIAERWTKGAPTFKKFFIASIMGLLACYLVALPYVILLSNLYYQAPKGLNILLVSYFAVFLPGDLLKVIISAWLAREVIKRIGAAGIKVN